MATDPPRCDYFALLPRPQKMIMDLLNLRQIHRLSVKSKKWQEKVKERNMTFDRYEIELGGDDERSRDDYLIRIIHHGEKLLKIIIHAEQQNGSYDAQMKELILAGDLLRHIFNFENYSLTLSPSPSFREMICYQFFSTEVVCDRIIIRDNVPLPRLDLIHLLGVFRGKELKTARISNGHPFKVPFNLEKVVIEKTNWLALNMVKNSNAKVVVINQDKRYGIRMTMQYVCSLLDNWYSGRLSNLEYFQCNFYFNEINLEMMSVYLTSRRRLWEQWVHDGRLRESKSHLQANTCRQTDGKYAYILVKERIGKNFYDLHFCTSTTRVINNRFKAWDDRKPF